MWVNGQRAKKDAMPAERRRQLEALGFIWDALSDQWEQGLKYLRIYVPARGTAVFLLVISRMVLRLEHGFIIDAEIGAKCL